MADKLHPIELSGLQVTLGQPQLVTEGVGHYWFPNLAKFPSGELLLTVGLAPDSEGNLVTATSVFLSSDGGKRWDVNYDVAQVPGMFVARRDGALAGPTYHLYPDPPDQGRHFAGHYIRFTVAGQRYVMDPWGAHVESLPRDVAPSRYAGKWGRRWMSQLYFNGDVVEVDGLALGTAYVVFAGESRYALILLASADEGRNWRYVSTIAGPDAAPDGREGPCEASMIQLADGDLMCVMRVGSGPGQQLARAYSNDGGKSWSPVDRLPAVSVEPSLLRLQNGVLALSTGRPGIYLWLAADARGAVWQSIDIVAHHNGWAPDPSHTIVPDRSGIRAQRHAADQTTAYTQLVEVEPNHLLLVYDRTPFGWNPVPIDSDERSRIYVLPMIVERG